MNSPISAIREFSCSDFFLSFFLFFVQECCRTLCFDEEQKIEDSEDLTAPLDMMDMTAMIVSIFRHS